MSLIDKAYFTLEELEERWQLPHRDLVYLAENGLLRLSVRLFGVEIECGMYEEGADGEWFTVPQERRRFTGFQDLQERDVFRAIPARPGRRGALPCPGERVLPSDRADRNRFHLPR